MAKTKINLTTLDEKVTTGFDSMHRNILEMRDVIIKNLIEEKKRMHDRIQYLEDRLVNVEQNVESNNQYNRRNNLEISGIPNHVNDDELETKVIEIFDSINIDVCPNDIEACHRLPPTKNSKTKKTIIRFVNRKLCVNIMEAKKNLKQTDIKKLGFPDDTLLYINPNLNRYFQRLLWKCRTLKRRNKILSFKFQNESVLIKKSQSERFIKLTGEKHIDDLFPTITYD